MSILIQDKNSEVEERRLACHRCDNMRKKNIQCNRCPAVFCVKCAEKMYVEHGNAAFKDGCPVCKSKCCCKDKSDVSTECHHLFHCLKRCLYSKALSPQSKSGSTADTSDSEDERELETYTPQPNNHPSSEEQTIADKATVSVTPTATTSKEKSGNSGENINTPALRSNKRKYNRVSGKQQQQKSKQIKSLSGLNNLQGVQLFPDTIANLHSDIAQQIANKSREALIPPLYYTPAITPTPWQGYKPTLPPIASIIASTDARVKLPIAGVPELSNKPLLSCLLDSYLRGKPSQQILPLPSINLESTSLDLPPNEQLPPLNYSRTAIFSPNSPKLLRPYTIVPEMVPRLPSISSNSPEAELTQRPLNTPLQIDTSFPSILDTSSGFPTSSTISSTQSPYIAGPSPINRTIVPNPHFIASVPFPQMVDNIHDATLEDPFGMERTVAYETIQLQAAKDEASQIATQISNKFGSKTRP